MGREAVGEHGRGVGHEVAGDGGAAGVADDRLLTAVGMSVRSSGWARTP